jgi:hypothetical protein
MGIVLWHRCVAVIIISGDFMLFLPFEVNRYFKDVFDGRRSYSCVYADDLYTLMPSGDVYVHWLQEGPIKYTEKGAHIGKIKSPSFRGASLT